MNNPYKTFLFLAISFFTLNLQAQQRGLSKTVLQKNNRMIECEKKAINADDFFDTYGNEMGLSSFDEMRLQKTITGSNGYEHLKYQQFHQGVLVEGSAYTLHLKNGKVKSASGYYLPLINLNVEPSISEKEALNNAMQEMGAIYYNFNDPTLKTDRLSDAPTPKLVIMDAAYPKASEQYVLAYRVRLTSTQPLDKKDVFIHANYGQKIIDLPRMHHQAVPATVQTKFYGEQTIMVDSVAPKEFYLRDPTRNNNSTRHIDGYVWKDDDNTWELANENEDEVALDAHYCGQEFHDYLIEKFNWSGLDGNGEPMHSVVKLGNTVNAFWDGEAAHFYDGGCHHFPLTTLEVVAHEFTHGLTDYTSDLVYSSESGAINESMSDIFGKALEYHVQPNEFSWDLGHSFLETPYVESFRSFTNPNDREHPKFYNGE
jgi:Zn-dependent metalloprotease